MKFSIGQSTVSLRPPTGDDQQLQEPAVVVSGTYIGGPWEVAIGRDDAESLVMLQEPSLRMEDVKSVSDAELGYTIVALFATQNAIPAAAGIDFALASFQLDACSTRSLVVDIGHKAVPLRLRISADLERALPPMNVQNHDGEIQTPQDSADTGEEVELAADGDDHFEPVLEWCQYPISRRKLAEIEVDDLIVPQGLDPSRALLLIEHDRWAICEISDNSIVLTDEADDRPDPLDAYGASVLRCFSVISPPDSRMPEIGSSIEVTANSLAQIYLVIGDEQFGTGELVTYKNQAAIRIVSISEDYAR